MNAAPQPKTELSPYEQVKRHFTLPFDLYPFQVDAVNELAPLPRSGWWAEPGTGKTAMSTVASLYHRLQEPGTRTLVIMPPILLPQWHRWLCSIPEVGEVLMYRGTPKQRAALDLDSADFIVVSYDIFKRDHERFMSWASEGKRDIICDEATAIKNVSTDNHRRVAEVAAGNNLMLLSGTPISTPIDGYAYCRLVAPGSYRSLRQFEMIHVAERDFFGNVTKWANLGLLADNLLINSVRILKQDVLKDLPQVAYSPTLYELSREHQRLYERLAEEQLLLLEDGGKIDATSQQRLYQALQQIVMNPAHFSGKPDFRPAGYDLLDEVLQELDVLNPDAGNKLLIFANYKMTIRNLLTYLVAYKPAAAYSEISAKAQSEGVERFLNDPTCRVFIAHPKSAGMGLNLQEVCADVLFLELPLVPNDFVQAVARVNREGQRRPVQVRLATAAGTLQVRRQKLLLDKDEVANQVQGSFEDLRAVIFGG